MLWKTHLAISVFAILLFISQLNYKLMFAIFVIIGTFLPDIDNKFSTLGNFKGFRFFQYFFKHRSFLHSLTFCILLSLVLAFIFPVASLGFFVGYSQHIVADSFTQEGIQPFWPLKKRVSWNLKTGSVMETSILIVFVIIDLVLLYVLLA